MRQETNGEIVYDVLIVGSSFAGLTLAYYLPRNLRILLIDRKKSHTQVTETTGLITQHTYELFKEFVDVDQYIPNKVDGLTIVAPNYQDYFTSRTDEPWMYTTDTPKLLEAMVAKLPSNAEILLDTELVDVEWPDSDDLAATSDGVVKIITKNSEGRKVYQGKFLVGADGGGSTVAKLHPDLSQNQKLMVGFEKIYYGKILLGDKPETTVNHFWFGEFALEYGGWLSPTMLNGRAALRVGLALYKENVSQLHKLDKFVERLQAEQMIELAEPKHIDYFSSLIPMGGVLDSITAKKVMLLGDAAGFCGAFAADGIKGALISAKVAAELLPRYLDGDTSALDEYLDKMEEHNCLVSYYKRQLFYRQIWNLMRSDRSFTILYKLVKNSKQQFLARFCDSKDRHQSLLRAIVLRWQNFGLLVRLANSLLFDQLRRIWSK